MLLRMKHISIGVTMVATILMVESSTLCVRKNASCAYQLWKNESEQAEACQMTYYKLNSRECGVLSFEDTTIDIHNKLGNARLYAYVTEQYRQTMFKVSFTNIKWRRALLRFSRMGMEDERNTCRRFNIWENITVPNASALTYDCNWSSGQYEGQDYSLEYEFSLPVVAYTRFIFRVPFFDNFVHAVNVKSLQIFTYLDVTDSDFLHLHIQTAPRRYNITGYLVEVIRERSNISTRLTVQILRANEAIDGEIVFPYPTWNEFGYFYFNVSPISDVCEENTCMKSSTPKIFMGRKKSSLVIGIVGASVIVFALFYAMFFWNRQKNANKDTNSPRVLLIYKASLNSHCNVVRNLARLLNDVLQIEVLLDVFEVPETHHQDPILWCNQAINVATHIVYIASPEVPPNKVVATNNIYRIDGVAMKFITKKLARNDSSKQILVVTFPYSIDAVPPELSNVQRFDLMKDMDSFVNSLVMLPYQSWIFLHISRPNRFRGEPQYMELMVSILGAQREVEILTNCPTSPSSQAPKITITQNSTENIAAPEGASGDEQALLETLNNFSFRLSDLDISGNASAPQRPAIEANTDFSINIQAVAQ